jgi:hypothetical protein
MYFSGFTASVASARTSSTLRLPQPITASTGCALAFQPLQAIDLPVISAENAGRGAEPRRPGRDLHQGSYYARCRVAMGY